MKIEQIISDAAVKAVKALYGIEAAPGTTVPQKTKKEFEGNLTLVVFPFLKASHKAPEATAQEIGEYLLANEPAVASFNVIKGFLNLVIAPSFWSQMLHHIDEEADFGTHKAAADAPLVMVEYSSPNTNKPLHLGPISSMTGVFISVNRCWLGKSGATVLLPKRPEKKATTLSVISMCCSTNITNKN